MIPIIYINICIHVYLHIPTYIYAHSNIYVCILRSGEHLETSWRICVYDTHNMEESISVFEEHSLGKALLPQLQLQERLALSDVLTQLSRTSPLTIQEAQAMAVALIPHLSLQYRTKQPISLSILGLIPQTIENTDWESLIQSINETMSLSLRASGRLCKLMNSKRGAAESGKNGRELVPGACDVGITGLWGLSTSTALTVESEFHDPSITVHGGEQVARRTGGDYTRVNLDAIICISIYECIHKNKYLNE
jgi:hypothetical protein